MKRSNNVNDETMRNLITRASTVNINVFCVCTEFLTFHSFIYTPTRINSITNMPGPLCTYVKSVLE